MKANLKKLPVLLISLVIITFLGAQAVIGFPHEIVDAAYDIVNGKGDQSVKLPLFTHCVMCPPETWPLLDYPMYSSATKPGYEMDRYFVFGTLQDSTKVRILPKDVEPRMGYLHFKKRVINPLIRLGDPGYSSNIRYDTQKIKELIDLYEQRNNKVLVRVSLENHPWVFSEQGLKPSPPMVVTNLDAGEPISWGRQQDRVLCQTTAEDSSGNANHGMLKNESRWIVGKLGGALYLGGNRDYVVIGDVHGFEGTAPFTVSLWAKDSEPSGRLLGKEELRGTREGWLVFSYKNEGSYGFERWQGSERDNISFEYTSGQWNHVAFTYDGAYMKGYLNGVLVAGPTESAKSLQPTLDPLVIGAPSQASKFFYKGFLDDIRIYNRTLSSEEITGLAQMADNAPTADDGLVSYWKFDEGSGDTVMACGS
jgi:hypothetical protein